MLRPNGALPGGQHLAGSVDLTSMLRPNGALFPAGSISPAPST